MKNMREYTVSQALKAVCSFLLLLFSCIGAVEEISNAQANTPYSLSATMSAVKPTRTPPGRLSPTPTAHAPSPISAATLTSIPSLSANKTPSVKVVTPQSNQKHKGIQIPPISTQPTPSTTSSDHKTTYYQQKGLPFALVIIGTLSGMSCVMLLLIIALLLRKYLKPSARNKLTPSGAIPWQRVRINSLPDRTSNSAHSLQARPTFAGISSTSSASMPETDCHLPVTRNVISSRKDFSPTASNFPLNKKQSKVPAVHFLRPTKLKAIGNSGILAEPGNSDEYLTRQNSQAGALLQLPQEERDSEELPSLDDPSLQKTLQYYMLRGQLARQDNPGARQEHG